MTTTAPEAPVTAPVVKRGPGRPKGSKNASTVKAEASTVKAPAAPKASPKATAPAAQPLPKPVSVAPVVRGRGRPVKALSVNDVPVTEYHGETVALTLDDGSLHVGVLSVEQGVRNPLVVVSTGLKGRPPMFHADEIVKLIRIRSFVSVVQL